VIEQLTALPRTYTRQSLSAAAAFNNRIRLEGGANVLAAAQAAGVRRYLRQSIAFWAIPGRLARNATARSRGSHHSYPTRRNLNRIRRIGRALYLVTEGW